jgi:hypothetical protein
MFHCFSGILSLFRHLFDNHLENRIILNERILSALFFELARTKKRLLEELLKDDKITQETRDNLWNKCKEDIYKHVFDSIDYDYAININDFKKGLRNVEYIKGISRISFLDEFMQYSRSKLIEPEKIKLGKEIKSKKGLPGRIK